MRLFQILSLGTELVDELFFCLIMKPVYMRLYGWFLSFPVRPSFHNSFLTALLSPLFPSSPTSHIPLIVLNSIFCIFWFILPPVTFPSPLHSFSPLFSLSSIPFIPLFFCHLSLVVPSLYSLHLSFPLTFFLTAFTFLLFFFLTYFF